MRCSDYVKKVKCEGNSVIAVINATIALLMVMTRPFFIDCLKSASGFTVFIRQSVFKIPGKLFGCAPNSFIDGFVKASEPLLEVEIPGDIKEMKFDDEMLHFIGSKNKRWIIKALNRRTRQTVAWVTGGHDAATFKRPYV